LPLPDALAEFLDLPIFGVLATTNQDGSTQQTLMWYLLDGDRILMNTSAGRRKHRNIVARPEISLCAVEGRRYVTVTGPARILPDDPALHRKIGLRYVSSDEMDRLFAESYDHKERITIEMQITGFLDGLNV
jgi:PPOX class probable F420-dependent enzyme